MASKSRNDTKPIKLREEERNIFDCLMYLKDVVRHLNPSTCCFDSSQVFFSCVEMDVLKITDGSLQY